MSDKKEHIRHIDKTRQDRMPVVAERPRVKQWQQRIAEAKHFVREDRPATSEAIYTTEEN